MENKNLKAQIKEINQSLKEKEKYLLDIKYRIKMSNDKSVVQAFVVTLAFVLLFQTLEQIFNGRVSGVMYSCVITTSFGSAYILDKKRTEKLKIELRDVVESINALKEDKIKLEKIL